MSKKPISDIRKEYTRHSLDEQSVAPDPVKQFLTWFDEALKSGVDEINAMTLATSGPDNKPGARIVLLKGVDERGFTFFTNYNSTKGKQLEHNPNVALVFFWKELERQVRILGTVTKLSAEENDTYFNSRPIGSRIGAVASPQSTVIQSRTVLEDQVKQLENQYKESKIPRPEHWGGYLVTPVEVEFWQGRQSRLHDRILYAANSNGWQIQRLAP